jgi:hypothetical protein
MAENTDFGLAIVKVLEKQCYMGRLLIHARGIPSLASLVPPSSALSLEMRSTPRRSYRFVFVLWSTSVVCTSNHPTS